MKEVQEVIEMKEKEVMRERVQERIVMNMIKKEAIVAIIVIIITILIVAVTVVVAIVTITQVRIVDVMKRRKIIQQQKIVLQKLLQ